jgi:hypothetical protein
MGGEQGCRISPQHSPTILREVQTFYYSAALFFLSSSKRICFSSAIRPPQIFILKKNPHPAQNLFTDFANLRPRKAFRVCKGPIIATKARNIRTILATAHRDEHVGLTSQRISKLLRPCSTKVDTNLLHYVNHKRMHLRPGLGTRGNSSRLRWIDILIEKRSRHLGTTRVMNTSKDVGLHISFRRWWNSITTSNTYLLKQIYLS